MARLGGGDACTELKGHTRAVLKTHVLHVVREICTLRVILLPCTCLVLLDRDDVLGGAAARDISLGFAAAGVIAARRPEETAA